jgi:outer membrane murein-binding lipoprotein Lpp
MTMAKFSMTARRRRLLYGAAITVPLLLAGCAVEVQNKQAA